MIYASGDIFVREYAIERDFDDRPSVRVFGTSSIRKKDRYSGEWKTKSITNIYMVAISNFSLDILRDVVPGDIVHVSCGHILGSNTSGSGVNYVTIAVGKCGIDTKYREKAKNSSNEKPKTVRAKKETPPDLADISDIEGDGPSIDDL